MKLYTRTGDEGKTSVIGGRVSKDDNRVEAYGTIDELNSFVGQAAAAALAAGQLNYVHLQLVEIMQELFDCGSDLAFADPEGRSFKMTAEPAIRLEGWIDELTAAAPAITRFILPGSELSALLHVCRTVCRRAERRVVTLSWLKLPVNNEVLRYVNRLSDYFFAAARAANAKLGVPDIEYVRSAEVFRTKDK